MEKKIMGFIPIEDIITKIEKEITDLMDCEDDLEMMNKVSRIYALNGLIKGENGNEVLRKVSYFIDTTRDRLENSYILIYEAQIIEQLESIIPYLYNIRDWDSFRFFSNKCGTLTSLLNYKKRLETRYRLDYFFDKAIDNIVLENNDILSEVIPIELPLREKTLKSRLKNLFKRKVSI